MLIVHGQLNHMLYKCYTTNINILSEVQWGKIQWIKDPRYLTVDDICDYITGHYDNLNICSHAMSVLVENTL